MSELKKYDITTETGYTTTLLLSDEDAKTRGLLGEDTEAVAQQAAQAAEAAAKEAADKAAADAAAKEAADKAAADAAAKEAQTPQNKQARPAGNK
ncbi:putative membrane protein [Arthrobacter sp. UYNi723]